jgi:hypothetical protein
VFYDEPSQHVIKLFGPPGKAGFGWIVRRTRDGSWQLRAGTLADALLRFALLEELFPSGLELDQVGDEGSFLVLRQPFILGHHPDEPTLHAWMSQQEWTPHEPSTSVAMLRNLTWRRTGFVATDVRPENVLVTESDGELRAIDFVMAREEELRRRR